MQIRPLGNNILVRKIAQGERKIGSIIVPSTFNFSFDEFLVVAVGPGTPKKKTGLRVPPDVKPGDIVKLARYTGTKILVDGQEYLFIIPPDIMYCQEAS